MYLASADSMRLFCLGGLTRLRTAPASEADVDLQARTPELCVFTYETGLTVQR